MHPAQILDLSPFDLGLARMCFDAGCEAQASQIRSTDGQVFPVIVIGGL